MDAALEKACTRLGSGQAGTNPIGMSLAEQKLQGCEHRLPVCPRGFTGLGQARKPTGLEGGSQKKPQKEMPSIGMRANQLTRQVQGCADRHRG